MFLLFLVSLTFFSPSDGLKNPHIKSAASDGQLKFAIENKYDDTGPGATGPTAAYKTYNTLEQALVGYLDDPDTKLPESEKQKLLKPLLLKDNELFTHTNIKPKYFSQKQSPVILNSLRNYRHKDENLLGSVGKLGVFDITNAQDQLSGHLEGIQLNGLQSGIQKPRIGSIGNIGSLPPIKLSVFDDPPPLVKKFPESLDIGHFGPRPQYTYSYGVHDHLTGDAKSAHETRDGGGRVRGYYTVLDADGQRRTVHYTADDAQGFRATVQRTPTLF